MKTLVIGGTGQVGSHIVLGLRAKGKDVRVLSQSKDKALPAGVELAVGDLNDPYIARKAFEGIDAAVIINPVAPTEGNEGLFAAALAREAKLKRLVYMGVQHADKAPYLPHFGCKLGIEAAVKASGAVWTILQPNNFYQNDMWSKAPIMQYGVYPQPLGDVGLHRVDVRDIADAAVNALTASGFENRSYVLAGPDALTGAGCAEVFSAKLGKKVNYGGNDLDAWEKAVSEMLPPFMRYDFKMMYAHFQSKGLLATPEELKACEAIVGHPLRKFDAYVEELLKSW